MMKNPIITWVFSIRLRDQETDKLIVSKEVKVRRVRIDTAKDQVYKKYRPPFTIELDSSYV